MVRFRLFGLVLYVTLWAWVSSVGLWVVLSAGAFLFLVLPLGEALLGGLIAMLLHWASETLHQLGHAYVARRVGYPMAGIRYGFLLAGSFYPRDEPALPAAVHLRRAVGGPPVSLSLALLGDLSAWLLLPVGGLPYYLAVWFTFENLVVFFLGALLPLGFTDGSTLLKWWGKQ